MALVARASEPKSGPLEGEGPAERCLGWLRLLAAPWGGDATVEFRAFDVTRRGSAPHTETARYPATEAGLRRLAKDAVALSTRASGCYVTLNRLPGDLARNATDADVARRVWLLIDVDPARPGKVSSTENELQLAWQLATYIRRDLAAAGWPAPGILACSGNGYHLLYRVDLPADDGGLVKRCLEALEARHDVAGVSVDTSVHNPSRITKLYGTMARKGEETAERPYRLAEVLEAPREPGVVPRELLEELAAGAPAAASPGRDNKPSPGKRRGLVARAVDADDVLDRARAYLDECEPAVSGQRGHDTTLRVACSVGPGFGLDPEDCLKLLLDHYNGRCVPPWSEKELRHKVESAYAREERRGWLRDEAPAGGVDAVPRGPGRPRKQPAIPPVADPASGLLEAFDDPHRLGRVYLAACHGHPEGPLLRYWDEQWHHWDGRAWRPRKDREVAAEVTREAKAEIDRVAAAAGAAPKPVGTRLVGNVLQALRGEVLVRLGDVPRQPAWLSPAEGDRPPLEYLPTRSGLVHLPTLFAGGDGALVPPTPRYFGPTCLNYAFEPDAPEPAEWLAFLSSVWPEDPDAIRCLQEWFGYLITLDTRLQKILLLVGPRRSGKGTITRVLTELVGGDNVAAPTLASLATPFGLEPLIGRQVAVVPEARISGRADSQAIVERLLSISGEDPQTIDRKHISKWHGQLLCRLVLLGNELPRLGDHSGALASRLVVLQMERSFLGKEDLGLFGRLLPELPGILLWSIEGYRRLAAAGRFTVPESSAELAEEFERLSNPVGAFLEEVCDLGPGHRVLAGDLYQAWCKWCEDQGREHPGDQASLGRNLRAALPRVKITNPLRTGGQRVRYYLGLKLKSQPDDPDAPF